MPEPMPRNLPKPQAFPRLLSQHSTVDARFNTVEARFNTVDATLAEILQLLRDR